MCGIIGSFFRENPSDFSLRFDSALLELNKRGPDFKDYISTTLSKGVLTLGHTRLSIIDLSNNANQPMKSSDGRYVIIFNGEIYNYRELRDELIKLGHKFYTDSDTEVLLGVWTEWKFEGLRLLVGMFSFAIFDYEDQNLILVRDAFGIKPLFYKYFAGEIFFSSDINALKKLLGDSFSVNYLKVYDYLLTGSYDNDDKSFLEGVFHLLPAHYLNINLKTLVVEKPVCWWYPDIKENKNITFEDAAINLKNLFLKSVRLHLRSDVPIGATLSGGIDSSAIVCAMRYLEPKLVIHTFSYIAKDTPLNEEKWIDIVNNHVDAISHKVEVHNKELLDDLDELVYIQGEPFGTTSIYAQYKVFQRAKECGIIVVLDGQGADESLGGYEGYPVQVVKEYIHKLKLMSIISFLNSYYLNTGKPKIQLIKKILVSYIPDYFKYGFKRIFVSFGSNIPKWILLNNTKEYFKFKNNQFKLLPVYNRKLAGELRKDLTITRVRRLLRYEDRNSMCWSIESRVPFLTIELIEFLLSLPSDFLVSDKGETKRLFRAAMRGIVPDEILNRKDKIGFDTPEKKWILNSWDVLKIKLNNIKLPNILNYSLVIKYIETGLQNDKYYSSQIWRIINFCLWIKNQNK
jgi:asparagine synthase (glutamine-hydrolysing)